MEVQTFTTVLNEDELKEHIAELEPAGLIKMRWGHWIARFDNGMGCGVVAVISPNGGRAKGFHYE